ncbi:MAG TPA: DUF1589 domain-containing protein [Rhodopirellula baltica]|uniref:Uncharacterized protein n=1 Tax=Rhodopirellula baltica (strain DSM 10527 / NCIMB 13988 / SH1) TaxID=243090 RepID=Q7UP78_RHOBA|nr:hypothetical protein RB7110 [Rhodopirellula baltica SH 1]HBE65047.1 DUF1589 domain-containing protein [Rhodopirellula baltica]
MLWNKARRPITSPASSKLASHSPRHVKHGLHTRRFVGGNQKAKLTISNCKLQTNLPRPGRPGYYLAPSRCFGTKRGVQSPHRQAPNLPAIHHAMSNMAYGNLRAI